MGKKSAIILLGPRDNELEIARLTGHTVILFKKVINLAEALSVDIPIETDLNDEPKVLRQALDLANRFDIRAVFTLNEYRIPLAAKIASTLHLPRAVSLEATLNCRNKKQARMILKEHQVGSARYTLVKSVQDIPDILQDFNLPVIIKPSNDSGSNFVLRCESLQEVQEAVTTLQQEQKNSVGQPLDPELLLEEYLDGPEVSVEACTVNRKTTVLAVTAKRIMGSSFAEIEHLVPAPLSEKERHAITELVVDGLRVLGIDHAVTHTEVKLTISGPKIVEVNARPGGDEIPTLVRAVTGYDLRELSLHIAMGGTLDDAPCHQIKAPSAAIRFLVTETSGTVRWNQLNSLTSVIQQIKFWTQTGNHVEATTSNHNRLGYFIVHGTKEKKADQIAQEVWDSLNLRVTT